MFTDGYNEALDEKSAVYSGKIEHNDWFRLSASIEAISMDTNRTGTLHKDSIISFDCFTMRNDELYAVVSDICICSAMGYHLYTTEEALLVRASDLETNAIKDNDLRDFCEQKDSEMQHIRFATSPKHLALKIANGIACLISVLCLGIIISLGGFLNLGSLFLDALGLLVECFINLFAIGLIKIGPYRLHR